MIRKTNGAAAVAVAATLATTIIFAGNAGARAQGTEQGETEQVQTVAADQIDQGPVFVSEPVVQELPETPEVEDSAEQAAQSLGELVSYMPADAELSKDLQCLAGAVYFEARGEPLEGQLAVARVIVNRAESNRFPESYCGVVFQRSQFSFVRGGQMPAINTSSAAWARAKAVAQIAHEGLWDSPAKGALFFHATHVSPRWRLQRVAQVSRHVFYR